MSEPETVEDPSPEYVFQRVWAPLLINETGELEPDKLKQVLFDYGFLLNSTSILYEYLTNGTITDPQTPLEEVIVEAQKIEAQEADMAVHTVLNELLDIYDANNQSDGVLIQAINDIYERGEESHDSD